MASLTKTKEVEKLRSSSSSLPSRKDPALSKDLESGHITTGSSFAKKVFQKLFETIKKKRYHVETDKGVVYNQLMDHLDAVEETYPMFASTRMLVELLVFSGLLTALVCFLTLDRISHRRLLNLRMWQYIAVAMMVASGFSVVRFLTFMVTWPIKWRWRTHKYAVYFIRQLKRCVDVTLWFCIVLLGWYLWFRPHLKHAKDELPMIVVHQVTRFLIALCLGSFLWLLKNVLYLKLEADLHYDQLFERLQISVVYLHGLQTIYKSGTWRFLPDSKTGKKVKRMAMMKSCADSTPDDTIGVQGVNIWTLVKKMEKESVPIWILRRLEEEYLDQVKLHPLPGNSDITKDDQKILREVKKMFRLLVKKHNYSDLEIKRTDLMGEPYNLKEEELDIIFRSKKLDEEDDGSEAQAISRGTSEDRNISYEEFLNWAVRAYKNCWGLERTLNNSKRVFVKLNRLLITFLLVVMLIIWLLLSGIVNTGQLAVLFAPFVAASFIFGESCRKMFEGLIFAFAMHPFDVGDRVIINNVQMRVTNLKILTSAFLKYDTGEEVIVPNSTLTTASIVNLDITPDQSDKVEFVIDVLTPLEDIRDLEIKIKKFLDDDIEYTSDSKVVKSEILKEEMKMTVYFKYLVSYLTAESKAVHRSKILSMIVTLRNNMEMKMKINNKEPYPSSYQPYSVEIKFTHNLKIMLKHIEDLQAQIMRCIEERYKPYSKVVMTELTKSQVKMGLYVHYKERSEKEDDEIIWKAKAIDEKIKMNLEHICETLKENTFVKKVRICQDGKVVVTTSEGWDSFQARDVIQTQQPNSAHPVPTLDTIPSGDKVENGEAREEGRDPHD